MTHVAIAEDNHLKTVVLKLFGSWATFVFQKPFAGHKN